MARLQLENITKSFPGVMALNQVSLDVLSGEIHALCGENGAGKSTLMNILAGNLQPDNGSIRINEETVEMQNPQDAFSNGISIVYQHLSLSDNLSVAENVFANQYPKNSLGFIQFDVLNVQTKTLFQELHLNHINPKTRVSNLAPAQKQMVEIAKALTKKPSIFILDEPTASLSDTEANDLFDILKKLKNQGTSIIYISHRLDEIFRLADRISILKDGSYHGTFLARDFSKEELIRKMVGRNIENLKAESHVTENILLSVKNLSGERFHDISFELMCGEILGVGGLVGAGRTEIARAIFGADAYTSGEIIVQNEKVHEGNPAKSISKGMAYVPEDRATNGLFLEMSITDNVVVGNLRNTLDKGLYSHAIAKQMATTSVKQLQIATPSIDQTTINLSGGNQQKVVLAKWLHTNPQILIVDEPTHGIDVGAKFEFYEILKKLVSQGKGIIMISSDLPELLGICDRIMVIKKGTLVGIISGEEATEENIMALASN